MSDHEHELARLKAALKGAPAPSEAAKQAALRVAQENFDRLQENGGFARPTETQAKPAGFLKGLFDMFAPNSMKPLLLTTSSLVVIGLGVVLVQNPASPELSLDDVDVTFTSPTEAKNGLTVGSEVDLDLSPSSPQQDRNAEISVDATSGTVTMGDSDQVLEFAEAEPLQERRDGVRHMASDAASGAQTSLQAAPTAAALPRPLPVEVFPTEAPNTDRFANEAPNPLKITAEEPVSTFSTDVDTASYAWVRRSLQGGQMPDPAAVRVEEMINYFHYNYPTPEGDVPFATTVSVSETPWNPDTQLVHIGLQGAMPAVEDRPPLNLVFLIDTSGSMNAPDKLPLLVQSFQLMLSELRPEDEVAIVTYAGAAGLVLEPTKASDRATINRALANLSAGGSTAGAAGLQQAYQVAEQMSEEGEIGRVILATDGDFNVGLSSDAQMKTLIEAKRDSGTYLSVLGFGRGNINDALMQTLAQNGNGQAAYIDTLSEARKVLVDQLTGALFPIAGDVKVQVEWNPAQIAEYRLIGYETRALKREDFNNDTVDAGDIGAGLQVTALYEVTPVGSPAVLNNALRYGEAVDGGAASDELGFLRLRYKQPGEDSSKLIEQPISNATATASVDTNFAAAIAGFGQLLRGSDYLGGWSFSDAIALANAGKGADAFGYRSEAITLMRLAESLSKSR